MRFFFHDTSFLSFRCQLETSPIWVTLSFLAFSVKFPFPLHPFLSHIIFSYLPFKGCLLHWVVNSKLTRTL